MTDNDNLIRLLNELRKLPNETQWVEFKANNKKPELIGEYISALANSAALYGKQTAYVVWGIDDATHEVVGTNFRPKQTKHNSQELESWLLQKLQPKINFVFHEVAHNEKAAIILEIAVANHSPVKFSGVEYIRIGSYKKKLADFAEKERELWRIFDRVPFEQQIAKDNLNGSDALALLDYPSYFHLLKLPLPENRKAILSALSDDNMLMCNDNGLWQITNLAAILFARQLNDFDHLSRKAVRIILYRGNSKVETVREIEGNKGYAIGFEGLIDYLKSLLPSNEHIGEVFREEIPMYPEIALRELVANAIIHQDFSLTVTGPMIELFDKRLEITNPGTPLVRTERFLDSPPQSRNEALASFMRRIHICEERGTDIDKVITAIETFQLPAPVFEKTENHTRSVLFTHKELSEMDSEERVRACYQHCCLKYVNREMMNNQTLRQRFKVTESGSPLVSRIIKQTVEAELIKLYDENANRRAYRYIPIWA